MPRLLVVPDWLAPQECDAIRRAMDRGEPEPAEVLSDAIRLDEEVRRAAHIEVDEDTRTALERRLDGCRPQLEAFFGVPLGDREGVSLLRYGTGGFFKRHRDRGDVPSWPDAARRLVSIVIFLTSSREADPHGTFDGGALTLHDHEGHVVTRIVPTAGTLVAFPSETLHEVSPVTAGTRETIVDWFEEQP